VISDIFGKSGRDMLEALADLARGSMRGKKSVLQEALTGISAAITATCCA